MAPNDSHNIPFTLSLTEFFLLSLILVYESLCFFALVLLNLTIGNAFSTIIHKIHLPFLLGEAAFQSIVATCTFPITTDLWERFESLLIRPAINRAKAMYRNLPTVTSIFSILVAIGAFWIMQQSFYERFDIFIEQSESPLQCLITGMKYIISQILPYKKDRYIYSILKVDENDLDEAENTNGFILSSLYLKFFLWKWIVKHTPDQAFQWSQHVMTQLKVNCLLGALNIGLTILLSNLSNEAINSNVIIMGNALAMAYIAVFIPWEAIFGDGDDVPTGQGDEAARPGQDSHSTWISIILFVLSSAGLVFIFFKAEFIEDEPNFTDTNSEAEMLNGKLNELVKYDPSRLIMSFRGLYGFQVMLILRRLTF